MPPPTPGRAPLRRRPPIKKQTGFTPYEYLVNTRMNNARYLLKNSALPVKEVCFSTGFSSESSFCSAFKRIEGVGPTQYRAGG